MKNIKTLSLALLVLFSFSAIQAKEIHPAKKFAKKAIFSIFFSKNLKKNLNFFANDCQHKHHGVKDRERLEEELKQIPMMKKKIDKIVYFTEKHIDYIKNKYPKKVTRRMFQHNRIPAHIHNGLGTLIFVTIKHNNTPIQLLVSFIFKKVGNTYKIVYTDDN